MLKDKTRPQETLEVMLTKSAGTVSIKTSLELETGKWLLGVTSLGVNQSAFEKTKNNNKFAKSALGKREGPQTYKKRKDMKEKKY